MFTVKATYKKETRKLLFEDSTLFPSYNQLFRQLYSVFPITQRHYLSKLFLSSPSESNILVAKEVHSAEDYENCILPYRGKRLSGATLRLTVRDKVSANFEAVVPFGLSNVGRRGVRIEPATESTVPSLSKRPSLASLSGFETPTFISPPPIMYSPTIPQVNISSLGNSPSTDPTSTLLAQRCASATKCCDVAQGKVEVESLIAKFKDDLQRIMKVNFESQDRAPSPGFSSLLNAPSTRFVPLNLSTPVNSFIPAPPVTIPMLDYLSNLPCLNHWCGTCSSFFKGPWFSCQACNAFVQCPKCTDTRRQFWHCGPLPLKRETCSACPAYENSLPFSTSNLSSPPSLSFPANDFSPPPTCGANRSSAHFGEFSNLPFIPPPVPFVPPPLTESPPVTPAPLAPVLPGSAFSPEQSPVVHKGIICDVCNFTIVGVRHKCLDCADYDLCSSCMSEGLAAAHNPFHEFLDLKEPGRVVVHTVYSSEGARTANSSSNQSSDVNRATLSSGNSPGNSTREPVEHNATCDLCESRITGERYKCVVCPDFDTCELCFSITSEQHPNHSFVKLTRTEDLITRRPRNVTTHHATCDACLKHIIGTRYKCMHSDCPDYDLCENCEAHPISVHPPLHSFLKIKSADIAIPKVFRAGELVPVHTPEPIAASVQERPCFSSPRNSLPKLCSGETAYTSGRSTRDHFNNHLLASPPQLEEGRKIWADQHHDRSSGMSTPAVPQYIPPPKPASIPELNPDVDLPTAPISPRLRSPLLANSFSAPKEFPEVLSETLEESLAELVATTETVHSSGTPALQISEKLPPLAVDPASDVFREFWPRVTNEFDHLLQEASLAQESTATDDEVEQPEMVERHETGLTSLAGGSLALIQTPLSSEPLLRRPSQPQAEATHEMSTSRLLEVILGARASSPARDTTVVNKSEDDSEETAKVTEGLKAKFVSDVTINGGQLFPPGAEFVKAWRMMNNGSLDWPETTRLVYVAGDQLTRDRSVPEPVEVGNVPAGVELEIWTGELKAPETTGKYVGYWKLEDGQGNLFGESVWIEVTVADIEHSGSSGEESLASSSIIMPFASASADKQSTRLGSPSTVSPVTAPSRPQSERTMSPTVSSGSLISFISDEGEEEWDDVRSHTNDNAVQEGTLGGATEYVVLYDDEVSSEEGW